MESWAGFAVPHWRRETDSPVPEVRAPSFCLAPFRRSPPEAVDLLVTGAGLSSDDVLVDLGCGDASLLVEAASRTGCRCVGVEASAVLVFEARARVSSSAVSGLIAVEHADAASRPLAGATVVYSWLLPGGLEGIAARVDRAVPRGLRAFVVVGSPGAFARFGRFERLGQLRLDPAGQSAPVWMKRFVPVIGSIEGVSA